MILGVESVLFLYLALALLAMGLLLSLDRRIPDGVADLRGDQQPGK